MQNNAGSGDPSNPVMTRGRLRDLIAVHLRRHSDIREVNYVKPSVGDTLGMSVTATDAERFRLWIARDHEVRS
jgi:hypothetical protein